MKLFAKEYGDGFPLIILHGLLGSSGNWHTLSRNVFGTRYRVFTLDLRNHGQSPHSDEMTYELMAGDVREFMEDQGLSNAHVLGHSMGGKVAMELATAHPETVNKLIVVDIAPKAYPDHHTYILNALSGVDLANTESRQDVEAHLAKSIDSYPVRQFLLKNLGYDKEKGYFWKPNLHSISETYGHIAGERSRGSFEGDTLFVRGGDSDYIVDSDMPLIRESFPSAQLETIEGAGHWVHAEAPSDFSVCVMDFLKDDDATAT